MFLDSVTMFKAPIDVALFLRIDGSSVAINY